MLGAPVEAQRYARSATMSSRDRLSSPSPPTQQDSLAFLRDPDFQSTSSAASIAVSTTSSYRHRQASFSIPTPTVPKPVLMTDTNHEPKTRGALGIMIVGLGGANGTTLLAGVLANRQKMDWRGARGEPMSSNYFGCITQLEERGGGVGYKNKINGLADASMAAVGGWDIRPAKLGDALLDAQILDYDLVRQLQGDMNRVKVFRGLYDKRFIGASQHAGATHILSAQEAPTASEALKCLRADIRYFKWGNGVVGHTTVIWSASVEPNCELLLKYKTAIDLLNAIEMTDDDRGGPLPPSLLYATAALLERCSFVNGGSQNTLSCPGLVDLAEQQLGVYCLGTDFKAGQTKFKTAAVEYIRTMGLTPKVIASSNHLGNNDMKNLASAPATSKAKLRVKHDIFAPWEEDIDHKVSIMYTPIINDEKRDFVEYTSLGFLGQTHTMVTYTRASDSVLCVPLMIDAAVWCDLFANRSWSYDKVAKALAYLFKVPEGSAMGVDPGFFRQMEELKTQAYAASEAKTTKRQESGAKKRVRIRPEEKRTEWAIPSDARIVCAGLACVDMQLNQASGGDGGESIETFEGEKSIGGGSVSMACKTVARLCHGALLNDGFMQVTPPVVHSIVPLCKIGHDDAGNKLVSLLEGCGAEFRNVDTSYIKKAREEGDDARTALSVLPIYRDGRRGCFFDAASNATFSPDEMIRMIHGLTSSSTAPDLDTSQMSIDDMQSYQDRMDSRTPAYGAFLFGYPHLLPRMQGESLARIFVEARSVMIDGGIVALDLNGVPDDVFTLQSGLRNVSDLKNDRVLGPALEHVDILHMNEDELMLLTGCEIRGTEKSRLDDEYAIESAVDLFLQCGVAVVAVTRGRKGSFVSCNSEVRFNRSPMLPAAWFDCNTKLGSAELPQGTSINTNGAGDSFTAGLLVATMLRHTGMTVPLPKEESEDEGAALDLSGSHGELFEQSIDLGQLQVSSPRRSSPTKKQSTPYQLYMRENYVMLKKQLQDDKKAIFTKCHEMWEHETDSVKALYERKAREEAKEDANELSARLEDAMEVLDSTPRTIEAGSSFGADKDEEKVVRNLYMMNRALNLESAVQFASLVAAHHVDVSTRDLLHLDILRLLERALIVPLGLEEI